MPAELTIGALHRGDLPAVGELFAAHTGRPADLATLARWVDGWPSAGARTPEGLVGYAVCRGFAPDVAELAALLVAPASRDRGVGAHLVAHVEDACRARDLAAVVTVSSSGYRVQGEKRSSRPFYEGLGYRVVLETAATAVLAHDLGTGP